MAQNPPAPRILIVDDAAVVRRILAMTVREIPELAAAVIEEAESGTAAVDKLRARAYDLIFSEIQVRGIDGVGIVRYVREERQDARTPIVLISRLEQEIGSDAGRAVGATVYVPKPLSPHRIKLAIRRILTPPPPGAPPKRVLLADDDEVLRNFTSRVLASSGYAVNEASDGGAAIEHLQASLADAVLLDLCMPRVDGWGVLDHVRTMDAPPPVIVVSGVREVVPPGGLSRFISAHVFKPFRPGQLVQTLEDVLTRPAVMPPGGARNQGRRTFIADASVLDSGGGPLAAGLLVEVSVGGMRLELDTVLKPGLSVEIVFRVPGHAGTIAVPGVIRWSNATTLGAEISTLGGADEAVLRALVDL